MDLKAIKIDSAKVEAGLWVKNIPDLGDVELRVRGSRNLDARRLRQKLIRGLPQAQLDEPMVQDSMNAQITSQTILLEWRNVTIDGVDVPYSADKALELLGDSDWSRFRDAVAWAAEQVALQSAGEVKVDQKN